MSNIVSIIDGKPVTTSMAIAEGVGNPHKSVIRLIRDSLADLEDFGGVSFQNAPFETVGGTQIREIAVLNERQATLLMTYMRNNEVVRQFKKRLVKAFFEMASNQSTHSDLSRMDILRLALQSEEERLKLEHQNQEQSERIEKLENFFQKGMTLAAFGKMLNGVNSHELTNFCMSELGWLYNESRSGNNRRLRVYHTARDKYLTETGREIGVHGADSVIRYEQKLLKKGAKKLYDLYLQGGLPMKKTWDGEYVHLKFEAEAA